jgi:sugar phosphate isomerase/epimerase
MDRRTFLKSSVLGAGLAAGLDSISAAAAGQTSPPRPKAVQRLSSQEGRVPGRSLKEKVDKIAQWGGAGIELGPGFNPKDALAAIEGTPIKISAICAADGPYIVEDVAQQRKAVENAKRILDKAGEVGSTGVIMVPAFNSAKGQLKNPEARKLLIDLLREMGEHAVAAKCRMMMEPLNKGEAWYLRQLADAAAICRDVNSPGIGMMGDFYHMYFEETSDMGAFISAGQYLHHVHLASRTRSRILPHQENSDYRDGFRGLKYIGYQDFMSLECGLLRGTNADEEIPKTFAYLKQQWEEATI